MKFTLIAAVVVLALAHGSFAQDVPDLERLGQYFEEMKNKMTLELTELINKQDVANQAQTFVADRRTQLEPLATQLQEQLKSVATNVEEQIRPLATSMQAQIQPLLDNFQKQVEAMFQTLTEQARAIDN